MSSDKESQDLAAKNRIISHMNNDHHDSIVRYLQHYGKMSALSAYPGRLTDITLSSLTLTCSGRTIRVPLEPPMTSFREARERVVELDKQCRAALGHSDVTVRSYVPPTSSTYLGPFLVIIATFIGYSQRGWFAPGGPVARTVGEGFAAFSWRIQPWLFWGMVVVHGAEMGYFMAVVLRKHCVNPRQAVFWLWSFSVFIEGIGAQRRFKEHVQEVREKQKH